MQIRNIYIAALLFLTYSCASIVAPTGGPKDEEAPILKRSNPLPLSKNFKGNKVILEFNEFIQLKNPGEQPVISPALEESPKINVKEKQISIEFTKNLEPNTTYTIQFGNNIVDLNESNVLEDFRFVFSTGNEIDSGSFQIRSYHILDNTISENLVLALYDDLDSIHRRAEYATKFKTNGIAIINNIPIKEYYVISFDDANKNFIADKEELIGFSYEKKSSADSFQIDIPVMFDLRSKINKGVNAYRDSIIYKIAFKGLQIIPDKININSINKLVEKDTLILFTSSDNIYKEFIYSYEYDNIIDTIKIINKKNIHQCKLETKALIEADQKIIISSNCPIDKKVNKDQILIEQDSNIKKIEQIKILDDFNIEIDFIKEEDKEYKIQFINLNRANNFWRFEDTIRLKTKTKTSTQTANLTYKVVNTRGTNYIIQFLNKDYQLKYEFIVNSDSEINKKFIDADTYLIRIIKDSNNDNKWNTSDIKNKVENEDIRFYNKPLELRANWDVNDIIIDLSQLFDNQ